MTRHDRLVRDQRRSRKGWRRKKKLALRVAEYMGKSEEFKGALIDILQYTD